jgi:UDP-N-acetylglucosamine/UDP-N-acetylgalactosamine diphosphorylase
MGKGLAAAPAYEALVAQLKPYSQEHLLRFWDELNESDRAALAEQIRALDLAVTDRLIRTWIRGTPPSEPITRIEPVDMIPLPAHDRADAREAWDAGEKALRDGRVGIVLVAGGQGTRLGFDGPKGTFPIGPATGRTLFQYHADRILYAQDRYGRALPWYIMVGESNEAATREYFESNDYLGLNPRDVRFFTQAMMPTVGDDGKILLESKARVATNPNGHGGCIPALVENGILDDAERRGIDLLSYFQVDNWAVKPADPYFIGYHLLRTGEMSSKVKRKATPRESSGVFCVCDGKVRVIEYTELDIYPALLETDARGELIHRAANAGIHIIDVGFVRRVYERYDEFPWHCSHKKVAHIDSQGKEVRPDKPNAYKFETFVFDALIYAKGTPLTMEIDVKTEYALSKQMDGPGGVNEARKLMHDYWAKWLKAAGCTRDLSGVNVEISPRFASYQDEFVKKSTGVKWPATGDIAIGPNGEFVSARND